jgi:hypothetical protein
MKMNLNVSLLRSYKLLGIVVFDIAVILAFFQIFSVLLIFSSVKLGVMLLVLLTGLLLFNGAVLFPNLLFRRSSPVYPVSVIVISILYLLLSNFISLLFVAGSLGWYLVLELLLLAALIGILVTLSFFADRESGGTDDLERTEKATINMQLMIIESSLMEKQKNEALVPIIRSFKRLKERIHASTPFGRITGNSEVYELENTIRDNLEFIQLHIRSDAVDKNIEDIQNLIEETRKLIVNREALNVR